VEHGHQVAVLTNPDTPSGRGAKLTASPIADAAAKLGLTTYKPEILDQTVRGQLSGTCDLLVSFAFGKIFGPKFLALFPQGGLNVHPSLLPRWRGPSPLTAAILARDSKTGISIQKLALAMDTGDVLLQDERGLDGSETTGSLTLWAAEAAVTLLIETIEKISKGQSVGLPQDETQATYCRLIEKADGLLHWDLSALELDAAIRAYDPWPGAYTLWRGEKIRIKDSAVVPGNTGQLPGVVVSVDKSKGILIQTKEGQLAIRQLQLPSRKYLDFRSFLNGNPHLLGSRLGDFS